MTKSEKNYTIMLYVFTAMCFLCVGVMTIMTSTIEGDPRSLFALRLNLFLFGFYFVISAFTLVVRTFKPEVGEVITKPFNYILFLMVPWGTIVALYGFRKLGKENESLTTIKPNV